MCRQKLWLTRCAECGYIFRAESWWFEPNYKTIRFTSHNQVRRRTIYCDGEPSGSVRSARGARNYLKCRLFRIARTILLI